jgi:hydroxymethylbilane synthase
MTTLRLATRRSKLALAQARAYADSLVAANPGLTIEELHIVTSGDKFQDRPLQDIGGKGLFIKEVEEALLDSRADVAVHSIKDVPAEIAPGLAIAAIPEREDPRDVLVSRSGGTVAELPKEARVGTSSLRRKTLLLQLRPDLRISPLRGNVDTRLRKLEEGQVDAIVLAMAGLNRLGMGERATEQLSPEQMLPAVGQGALGIECRADDERVKAMLVKTDHPATRLRVAAERGFMIAVEGNCRMPVACYALKVADELWLRGMLADDDGQNMRRAEQRTPWVDEASAADAGRTLGASLRG